MNILVLPKCCKLCNCSDWPTKRVREFIEVNVVMELSYKLMNYTIELHDITRNFTISWISFHIPTPFQHDVFPSKPTQSPPIQALFKLGSVKAGSKETSNLINPFLGSAIENTCSSIFHTSILLDMHSLITK